MFHRKFLSSILTLGMFVGACDMTALYPGVSQSLGFNPFDFAKISARLSHMPDPPNGTSDPPGYDDDDDEDGGEGDD